MIYNRNRIFNMTSAPNESEEEWCIVQQFVSSLVGSSAFLCNSEDAFEIKINILNFNFNRL